MSLEGFHVVLDSGVDVFIRHIQIDDDCRLSIQDALDGRTRYSLYPGIERHGLNGERIRPLISGSNRIRAIDDGRGSKWFDVL